VSLLGQSKATFALRRRLIAVENKLQAVLESIDDIRFKQPKELKAVLIEKHRRSKSKRNSSTKLSK
jgi:hypothetical protein